MISFFNSNFFIGLVTIIVGLSAYLLYLKQKIDNKRNAARIILQEIRRAEDIISDYKEHGRYKFTKKIIATNSWAKNIHYFVGDLDVDELDKISNLYSTGEYLDSVISKISDVKFEENVKSFEESIQRMIKTIPVTPNVTSPIPTESSGGQAQSGRQPITMPIAITLPAPWKKLLDDITYKYEPIYHSAIVAKLKKIAQVK